MNPSSFTSNLQKCCTFSALSHGLHIHMCITALGFEHLGWAQNNLLRMYLDCDAAADAHYIFGTMHSRSEFAWNLMIRAYLGRGQEQEVFHLFQQMHTEGTIPDTFVFVSVISACSSQAHSIVGMHLHAYLINMGLDSHSIVATSLVSMYGKHGLFYDAVKQFDLMSVRNVASWNALISACADNYDPKFCIYLYTEMLKEGVLPDRITFVNILRACAILALLLEGKKVHASIASKESKRDVVLDTALLDLYGKCNSLERAQEIFFEMQDKHIVSWTALMSAYSQHKDYEKAAYLYNQMHQECVLGDQCMLVNILDACACESGLRQGRLVHACIAGSDIEVEIVTGTTLVNLYGKNGDLDSARRVFDMIKQPNKHCCNSMLSAYLRYGYLKEALELFGLIHINGIVEDDLIIVNILQLCARQGAEASGKYMHFSIVASSLENSKVQLALIELYAKLKRFCDTSYIFNRVCERTPLFWNAMIDVSVENGQEKQALQLFEQMLQECSLPNKGTSMVILTAIPRPSDTFSSKQLHTRIVLFGFVPIDHLELDSISQYGTCGNLEMAWRVFDGLPDRNVDTWKAIINAAFNSGKFADGIDLCSQMQSEGLLADKCWRNMDKVWVLFCYSGECKKRVRYRMRLLLLAFFLLVLVPVSFMRASTTCFV